MANIQVKCPTCKETLEIDARYEGQEVECGSCLQPFIAKKQTSRRRDEKDDKPRKRYSGVDDDDDDYDDSPRRRRRRRGAVEGNSAATASLVMGLLSLPFAFCCALFAVPLSLGAIVTGAIGMKNENGKGMAITGLILGILGLVFFAFVLIVGIGFNGFGRNGFN
jgi:DNA-directed RNA polymerase subunit M/transcription elongation factor TFIIS